MKEFTEKDKTAVIILDSLKNLSYNQKREILSSVSNPAQLLEKGGQIFGIPTPKNRGVEVITYLDKSYPKEFLELKDYPLCLYCLGNLGLLSKRNSYAVVGSRKTIAVALQFASSLSKALCKRNVIVTGNTFGVEFEVLKATQGENTVCFLAGGIEKEIKSNPNFYSEFLKRGLLVSAYFPDMQTRGYQFIERNLLIAKFCDNLVVISGNQDSGVRYTAEFAQNLNKRIYALPYTVGENTGKLNNALIKEGASILYQIEDIVTQHKPELQLSEVEKAIVNLIKEGCDTVDKIIGRGNIAISEVFTALVSLEMKDVIIKCGADEYVLTEF